jgi:DNA-directed RNA polymerase I subunit RPA2
MVQHSFQTVERERVNLHPSPTSNDHPRLLELTRPHIASFDALFHPPLGSSSKQGLLDKAVENLKPKVIFDGKTGPHQLGNKLECEIDRCSPLLSH